MLRRRRFIARRGGGCEVRLPHAERQLLEQLPVEVAAAIGAVVEAQAAALDETGAGAAGAGAAGAQAAQAAAVPPALRRLFPRAYSTDDEAERRYRELTRNQLSEHHQRALHALAASAQATSLSAEETLEWLSAINDLRLVLGTVLDVTDYEGEIDLVPPAGADAGQYVVYSYLSGLEAELIDVVSAALPPPVPGADDQIPEDPWGEPIGGVRWDGTPRPAGPEAPEGLR